MKLFSFATQSENKLLKIFYSQKKGKREIWKN